MKCPLNKKSRNSMLNINVLSLTQYSPLPLSASLHPDQCHNPSPKSVTTAITFSLAEPEVPLPGAQGWSETHPKQIT